MIRIQSANYVLGVLVVFLLASACSKGRDTEDGGSTPEPSSESQADVLDGQARAHLQAVFDAIDAGDCQQLMPLLANIETEAECQYSIGDYRSHNIRLLEILDVRRDGRDPRALLIYANTQTGADAVEIIYRYTLGEDDVWRLIL